MADDIVSDLRNLYATYGPMDKGMLAIWKAADEIERLRRALALACGLLSTYEDHSMFHPEALMQQFLHEVDRG